MIRARAGESILLVEDEPAVRMLIADILQDLDYDVLQAADGSEALALAAQQDRIDLLITDVGLPGVNGRELAEMLREKRPELKILFVSGYAEQAIVRGEFLGDGMDWIAKPFEAATLAATVGRMMG